MALSLQIKSIVFVFLGIISGDIIDELMSSDGKLLNFLFS